MTRFISPVPERRKSEHDANKEIKIAHMGRKRLSTDDPKLTEKERVIVKLLAEGYTNKEVAALAHITVRTAETHRANIRRKLGLRSMAELIRYAFQHRIVKL